MNMYSAMAKENMEQLGRIAALQNYSERQVTIDVNHFFGPNSPAANAALKAFNTMTDRIQGSRGIDADSVINNYKTLNSARADYEKQFMVDSEISKAALDKIDLTNPGLSKLATVLQQNRSEEPVESIIASLKSEHKLQNEVNTLSTEQAKQVEVSKSETNSQGLTI